MSFNQKRGQVTIFVIIGVVLIIAVSFFIFFSADQPEPTITGDSISARLQNYASQCTDIVLEDYVSRALITGGYGDYPANIVRTENNNVYVLSFSSEGVPYGIFHPTFANDFLLLELVEVNSCLESLAETEYEIHGYPVNIINIEHSADIQENNIITTQNIEYEYQGNTFEETFSHSYRTNLGYFLERTNELTDLFLEEREPNPFFNFQFCETMYEDRGMLPKYSVDFLLDLDGDEARFFFDREFFLVFLDRGDESFPFAIKPYHDGYFC